MEIILASGSPRRRELLESFRIPFRVFVPEATALKSTPCSSSVTSGCMACRNRQIRICFADVSKVFFKEIGLETIRHYMSLVNVMDKAGAYAVQEHGELIIDRVEGSVNNVIGLPVERIAETLRLNGLL